MDSSFLTWVNVGLGLYSGISVLKMIIQFGLPNHPARFTLYLVCLCAAVYFGMQALTGLGLFSPLHYLKWRTLPLMVGGLGLLLQAMTTSGQLSLIQQRVVSRIPLIGALLVFFFFPANAEIVFGSCILAGAAFLTFIGKRARYQMRMFLKMAFFLGIYGILVNLGQYWTYVIGEMVLFVALFYFYIFEQTFGVSSLVEGYQRSREGVV